MSEVIEVIAVSEFSVDLVSAPKVRRRSERRDDIASERAEEVVEGSRPAFRCHVERTRPSQRDGAAARSVSNEVLTTGQGRTHA